MIHTLIRNRMFGTDRLDDVEIWPRKEDVREGLIERSIGIGDLKPVIHVILHGLGDVIVPMDRKTHGGTEVHQIVFQIPGDRPIRISGIAGDNLVIVPSQRCGISRVRLIRKPIDVLDDRLVLIQHRGPSIGILPGSRKLRLSDRGISLYQSIRIGIEFRTAIHIPRTLIVLVGEDTIAVANVLCLYLFRFGQRIGIGIGDGSCTRPPLFGVLENGIWGGRSSDGRSSQRVLGSVSTLVAVRDVFRCRFLRFNFSRRLFRHPVSCNILRLDLPHNGAAVVSGTSNFRDSRCLSKETSCGPLLVDSNYRCPQRATFSIHGASPCRQSIGNIHASGFDLNSISDVDPAGALYTDGSHTFHLLDFIFSNIICW